MTGSDARRSVARGPGRTEGVPVRATTGEDGASPITSVVGVAIFLVFLLFSVQVVLYLFTASVAQAAAVDGAQFGAGAAQTASRDAARSHAEQVLGRLADTSRVTTALRTDVAGEVLVVTVEVETAPILSMGGRNRIVRSAEARVER